VYDPAALMHLRRMLADLAACIGVDPRLGGLARHSEIDNVEIAASKGERTVGAAKLDLTVIYRTPFWEV
jgi:hypothetical protein